MLETSISPIYLSCPAMLTSRRHLAPNSHQPQPEMALALELPPSTPTEATNQSPDGSTNFNALHITNEL
ncbi:hypothetical protein B0T16DRAFT_410602 [Cercophora newfieldiana]|uniref:Uncharacterized protein n=1 Tax=Cercophora newfieldiana TaxID=92897 RepID=A0AA39YEU4_9PEZI|nr:hypothetical protein B0T16DRAFT_410602 [Cercophora newfieldiana]